MLLDEETGKRCIHFVEVFYSVVENYNFILFLYYNIPNSNQHGFRHKKISGRLFIFSHVWLGGICQIPCSFMIY